ncbi:hypothetical protein NLI96_g6583 [Meripilus lineatus]|uniref:Uncharacterized protein n=1 Tax=Meripilus lineatus TaxID=2056292 RepID=A0AAD5YDQ8_9APHY|nr:hypothetical protein NLI96_g6583 [Physisporinus lineatus]
MKSKAKGKGDHTPPAVEEYENGASRTGGRRNDDGCAASRGINIRVKKKARSRANSDDETESYARPTAVYASEPTSFDHATRLPQGLDRVPNPSSFSALSSAAMEELYALERAEAIRRAEYEILHSEALRRAEHEARHPDVFPSPHSRLSGTIVSPSAAATHFTASRGMTEEHGFHTSRERDFDHRHRGALGMYEDDSSLSRSGHHHDKRSGTSSTSRRDSLPLHPHSSGHVVDAQVKGHHHASWNHPYHSATHSRHHLHERHDESPSPISSDSDSMAPSQSPPGRHSHAHTISDAHPVPTKADFIFTPSTSPFLGGLRTLNLHSAVPSRAPSPFHLSPPHPDSTNSPIDEFGPRSRSSGMLVGSPPGSRILSGRKRGSTGDLVSLGRHSYSHSTEHSTHSSPTGLYHVPYSAVEPSLTALPTPQLSSGPSSSGSSPGTHPHSLASYPPPPTNALGGSGSLSAESSRPPSPPLWPASASYPHHQKSAGSYHHQQHHSGGKARDHPHHHHIAHSVRVAFGMTPIHPRSRHSASATTPSSASSGVPYSPLPSIEQQAGAGGELMSSSVPVSRASSPPIKLPPLKLPSSPSSPSLRSVPLTVKELLNGTSSLNEEKVAPLEHVGKDDVQDHLPGFSEVEAATCRRL